MRPSTSTDANRNSQKDPLTSFHVSRTRDPSPPRILYEVAHPKEWAPYRFLHSPHFESSRQRRDPLHPSTGADVTRNSQENTSGRAALQRRVNRYQDLRASAPEELLSRQPPRRINHILQLLPTDRPRQMLYRILPHSRLVSGAIAAIVTGSHPERSEGSQRRPQHRRYGAFLPAASAPRPSRSEGPTLPGVRRFVTRMTRWFWRQPSTARPMP
jgi:hypothetical protein